MLNDVIDIVFIMDINYILPTEVAIKSLIRNANDSSQYNIHIIADDICRKKWNEVFSALGSGEKKNIALDFVEPDNSIDQKRFTHAYVSSASLQKFSIAGLFPSLDKILYLDGDILIKGNIAELFHESVDDHYAAVVKDMPSYFNPVCTERRESYGLKEYFNSGMMLLNLKRLREEGIREKLISFKEQEKDPLFMDQDVFNAVFHEDVKFLSPKYNYIINFAQEKDHKEICEFYGIDSKDITDEVMIIHFAGPEKPWEGMTGTYSLEWLSYLDNVNEYPFLFDSIARKNKKANTQQEIFNAEMIRREEELSRQNKELYEMVNVLNQFMTQAQGQITSLFEYHNDLSTKAKIFQDTNESFNTRISILEEKTGGISLWDVKKAIKKVIKSDE